MYQQALPHTIQLTEFDFVQPPPSAPHMRRLAAAFIDWFCAGVVAGALMLLTFTTKQAIPQMIFFCLWVFASDLPWAKGRSIGKRATGLAVVELSGRPLSAAPALRRFAARLIPGVVVAVLVFYAAAPEKIYVPPRQDVPWGASIADSQAAFFYNVERDVVAVNVARAYKVGLEKQDRSAHGGLILGMLLCYVVGLFRPDGRALHDLCSGTIVVDVRKPATRIVPRTSHAPRRSPALSRSPARPNPFPSQGSPRRR